MRCSPKSLKTGHTSQRTGRIGPSGHSIPEHTPVRLELRGIL